MVGKVYDDSDVWFNFGLIDKAPILTKSFKIVTKRVTDPSNEKFVAFEFNNARSNDGTLAGKLNVYNTSNDRIATRNTK